MIFIDTVTFRKGHPNQKGGCQDTLDTPPGSAPEYSRQRVSGWDRLKPRVPRCTFHVREQQRTLAASAAAASTRCWALISQSVSGRSQSVTCPKHPRTDTPPNIASSSTNCQRSVDTMPIAYTDRYATGKCQGCSVQACRARPTIHFTENRFTPSLHCKPCAAL